MNNEEEKNKKSLKRGSLSKVIAILIVFIIIILAVYICYKNIKLDTISQVEENSLLVETNNGYKTFNFTVDKLLNAYKITQNDTISNSESPYCKEHSGTVCIRLPIETKYVDMSVVYENKSRKIISIEVYMPFEKGDVYLNDIRNPNSTVYISDDTIDTTNLTNELSGELLYKYLITSLSKVFTKVGKAKDFLEEEQKPKEEEKELIDISVNRFINNGKCGWYQMIGDNVGQVLCTTTKGAIYRMIATDKNEFFNLSINSLLNLVADNDVKKNENDNLDYDNVEEQTTVKSIDSSKDIVYTLYDKSYPIINLDSSEIEDINDKIEQNYKGPDKPREFGLSEYNYYLNNEILSLVISTEDNTGFYYYDVYNINVKTGKIVSNADLLKSKNIDEQSFLSKLPEYYKNKFMEVNSGATGIESTIEGKNLYEEQYNKTISTDNYNMQTQMFLDNNQKINIVAKIYSLAGADYYYHIINTYI